MKPFAFLATTSVFSLVSLMLTPLAKAEINDGTYNRLVAGIRASDTCVYRGFLYTEATEENPEGVIPEAEPAFKTTGWAEYLADATRENGTIGENPTIDTSLVIFTAQFDAEGDGTYDGFEYVTCYSE